MSESSGAFASTDRVLPAARCRPGTRRTLRPRRRPSGSARPRVKNGRSSVPVPPPHVPVGACPLQREGLRRTSSRDPSTLGRRADRLREMTPTASTGRGSRNPPARRNVTRSVTAPASRSPVSSRRSTMMSPTVRGAIHQLGAGQPPTPRAGSGSSGAGSRPSRSRCPTGAGRSGSRCRRRASGRNRMRSSSPVEDCPRRPRLARAGERLVEDLRSARGPAPASRSRDRGVERRDRASHRAGRSRCSLARSTIAPATPIVPRAARQHHTGGHQSPRHRRPGRGRSG